MESYLDFDLEIGPGQGRDYPLAARSEAGEARGSLHFPYDTLALESRLKDLRIALLRSGGQTRLWLTPEEQAVHDFGRDLFNALLAGKVLGLYRASLARAAGQNQGLRLRLNIRSPELAALPWEFLYDEDQSEYVCLCAQTPLVRYLEAPLEVKPLEAPPPLRILGMVAAPSDLPPLDVHTEKQRLERALADLRRRGLVEVTWLEGDQASWRALQRALRTAAWHVFHFIGHGGFDRAAGEGVLHLVGGDGAHAPLRASQLARLLADNLTLRLALLNACQGASASAHDLFSSTAATLARRGLPAVLAMQYAITDLAAIELAQSFYEALADGLPVDAAAAEARKAVSLAVANSLEWGAPVLYLRAREAILFRLQPPVVAAAPQAGSAPSPATETLIEQEAGKVETGGFAIGQIKAESSDGESAMKAQERIEGLTESAILGRIYTGKVVRITDFGAFVEILPNIGGMVHISELDTQRVKKVEDVVRMGDAITVMVTDIDEQGKIRLSRAAVLKGWTPQAAAPSPAEIVLTLAPSVTMTLLRVPAGEFLMGSNEKKDEQAYDNELPQHRVYLDEYWIAKTPVTNTQYQAFVRATNHRVPSHWQKGAIPKGKEGHPVVYISWDDAADFCNWASRATGHRIELPSEAQWEKAARGADGRIYPWGDQSPDASRCNFDQKVGDTTPVGRYSPLGDSPYGCVDMAGNVWEWCADWYDSGEYARRAKGSPRNPAGPSSGEYHVVRGGSWYRGSRDVRAALRGWRAPSHRGDYLGLRCARSP